MKIIVSFIVCGLLIMSYGAYAQDTVNGKKQLSEQAFFSIVRGFHPVMKQAQIAVDKARASLVMARAGFDPVFYFNNNQKTFDGKNYYRYINPELKIPTWYGIELKAGTENNNGINADSELSPGQSSYLGISVPLAKNLLMDKRRAALKQAKIMVNLSDAERRIMINDLLYEAGSAYWNWVRNYEVKQRVDDMVTVSRDRFNLVKIGYRQGDRPALDTTEALAQLQQFEFMQSEALVNLQVSGLELSNFLWAEGDRFYQLDSTIVPDMLWQTNVNNDMTPLADLLAQATVSHPALAMYEQKLQALRIERKLKFQDLLPKIDLSANLLNKGYNVFNKIGGNFYENNNKFGISLGLPLRLSEGRGGYKLAGLKLKETGLEMEMKRQSVVNKLSAYFQEMTGLQKQVDIYGLATDNFEKLARGENLRFRAGEGTLFLVNSRENKLLEARQKLIELKTKWQKSKLAVQWAAGVLK
jgi:outer membrane protein TolC